MFAVVVIVDRGDTAGDRLHYMDVVFDSKWILRFFYSLVSSELWSGILGFGLLIFLNGEQVFDLGGDVGDNWIGHIV
jgi:hypothetical protein